jgi:hypothetical protein
MGFGVCKAIRAPWFSQLAAWDPHWSQAAACSDQLLLNSIGNLVLVL